MEHWHNSNLWLEQPHAAMSDNQAETRSPVVASAALRRLLGDCFENRRSNYSTDAPVAATESGRGKRKRRRVDAVLCRPIATTPYVTTQIETSPMATTTTPNARTQIETSPTATTTTPNATTQIETSPTTTTTNKQFQIRPLPQP